MCLYVQNVRKYTAVYVQISKNRIIYDAIKYNKIYHSSFCNGTLDSYLIILIWTRKI